MKDQQVSHPGTHFDRVLPRRNFLRAAAWAAAGFAVAPSLARASVPCPTPPVPDEERRLRMLHLHTNERIDTLYYRNGDYLRAGLDEIDWFLRDHRTGDVHQIDTRTLDNVHAVLRAVDKPDGRIEIICGYRTSKTNEMLRSKSTGVAQKSMHLEGRAIDLRVDGVEISRLRDAALELGQGGVGYYAKSRFVHIDSGRRRSW